jgi:hypothetical protein
MGSVGQATFTPHNDRRASIVTGSSLYLGPFGAIIEWYQHRRQHASLATRRWFVG